MSASAAPLNKRTSFESLESRTDVDSINLTDTNVNCIILTDQYFENVIRRIRECTGVVKDTVFHIEQAHGEAIYSMNHSTYMHARCVGEKYSNSISQTIANIMENLQALEQLANNPNIAKSDREVRGERYLVIINMFVYQINFYRKMEREQFTRAHDRLIRLATTVCPEIAEQDIQQALDNGGLEEFLNSHGKTKCASDKIQDLLDDMLDRQYYAASIERTIDELTALYNRIIEMANRQQAKLDALVVHLERVDTKVYGFSSSCNEDKLVCRTATDKRRSTIWLNLAVLIILIIVVTLGVALGVLKSQGKL